MSGAHLNLNAIIYYSFLRISFALIIRIIDIAGCAEQWALLLHDWYFVLLW